MAAGNLLPLPSALLISLSFGVIFLWVVVRFIVGCLIHSQPGYHDPLSFAEPFAHYQLCRHPEAAYPGRNRPPRLIRVGHGGRSGSGHSHRRRRAASRRGATVEEPARWRQRYQGTLRRLRDAGVRLPAGLEADLREYRHRWELELAGFALYLGYDWDEVTGDRL